MLKILLPLAAALFMLAGCSTRMPDVIVQEKPVLKPYKPVVAQDVPTQRTEGWVSEALQKEYEKWADTPYQTGGTSLSGTDCSSLVQQIYQDAFEITLPRSSIDQARVGEEVKRGSCKEGDLVFFKIDAKTRHSGIIVGKGKFLHASSSHGVKISKLNNPYWKNKVVSIKRVLPDDEFATLKPSK